MTILDFQTKQCKQTRLCFPWWKDRPAYSKHSHNPRTEGVTKSLKPHQSNQPGRTSVTCRCSELQVPNFLQVYRSKAGSYSLHKSDLEQFEKLHFLHQACMFRAEVSIQIFVLMNEEIYSFSQAWNFFYTKSSFDSEESNPCFYLLWLSVCKPPLLSHEETKKRLQQGFSFDLN